MPAEATDPAASATSMPRQTRSWFDVFSLVWSSGLGSGYFPVASGTFGTLAALPFAFALSFLYEPWWLWALVFVAFTAITVQTAHRAGQIYGIVDAKYIVSDEFAGLFLTVAFLPFTWQTAVAGFFVFRFFDILKPWPASFFDRKVKNGFGVTVDDLAAAVYARIVMEGLYRIGWLTF
ncbi:phosphatidylglycerophosphatase A [Vulgatibacter sp.]|uniref:phosphatidylglycerophosphatase A family protein n=1 Tax=Vulgatibacter sp. TaxID=1971226 RepID=UPI003564A855